MVATGFSQSFSQAGSERQPETETNHNSLQLRPKFSCDQLWSGSVLGLFPVLGPDFATLIKGMENQVVDCLSRYYEDGGGGDASEKDIEWANVGA